MLRIYCIYFDKRPIWQSNCILPIQAGRARTHLDLGIPSDDDVLEEAAFPRAKVTPYAHVLLNLLFKHRKEQSRIA